MMKKEALAIQQEILDACRKQDPMFCQFLEETGRIVIVDQKVSNNHGINSNKKP